MEIIPAIDLKGGRCVRLYQGDFARETVFSDDPAEVALRWQSQGAQRLHVVDLDGARLGQPQNRQAIEAILRAVNIPLQLGGGIRRPETVEDMLGLGIGRVILGTAAVEEPQMLQELCRRFDQAIVVGLDAWDGRVAIQGWLKGTDIPAAELARRLASLGVKRLIYTDIGRDGTLAGPNLEAIAKLVQDISLPVIASGGVSTLAHIEGLAGLGVEGVIIGRALYTGDIKLPEAIALGGKGVAAQ